MSVFGVGHAARRVCRRAVGAAGMTGAAASPVAVTAVVALVAAVLASGALLPVAASAAGAGAGAGAGAQSEGTQMVLQPSGELSHTLSLSTQDWTTLTNRSSARLELGADLAEGVRLFTQVDGDYDWVSDEAALEVAQAYGELSFGVLDLTLGRQLVTWGVADALNPMNFLCPARFDPGEISLTGRAVNGMRASLYGDAYALTAVAAFGFEPFDVYAMLERQGLAFPVPELPEPTLADAEWALLGEAWIGGWDLKAAWFNGWEDTPALWYDLVVLPSPPVIVPLPRAAYRRTSKLGFAAATAADHFGFWAEGAYVTPEALAELDDAARLPLSYNQPYWQVVIGADYRAPNRTSVELQYAFYGNGSAFNPYRLHPAGQPPEAASYMMGRVSCDLSEALSVSGVALHSLSDGSTLVVPQLTYDFGSGISCTVTLTAGWGDGASEFGSPLVPRSLGLTLTKAF